MLLTPSFPPTVGGIEQLTYQICCHTQRLQVGVVTPWVEGATEFDGRQSFRIWRTRSRAPGRSRLLPVLSLCSRLLSAVIARRPRVTLCMHVRAGLFALTLKRALGLPYVLACYGSEIAPATEARRRCYRRVLREAVHVVTVSRYTQSLLEQQYGLPSVRITVVSPGVDAHRFHPGVDGSRIRERWGLRGARVALTVGRLDATQRHKGQDRVIEAMPAVLRQVPQAHYVVVGHGDDAPRLRDLARRLGVAHRVTFAGAADERELPEFYAASNVYVMPSRHLPRGQGATFEGFGMVFLEAAAAGRPVIGGRTGGIADAVIDGGTGWLVDPERSEALAEAMVTLLGDSTRAQSLGRAGRERMLQEFSWPAVVTRFEDAVLGALPKAA